MLGAMVEEFEDMEEMEEEMLDEEEGDDSQFKVSLILSMFYCICISNVPLYCTHCYEALSEFSEEKTKFRASLLTKRRKLIGNKLVVIIMAKILVEYDIMFFYLHKL